MEMPWTLARDFIEAAQTIRRRRMFEHAVAARAAQADKTDWERWVKQISG
jgi:IMP cyclohydrolase